MAYVSLIALCLTITNAVPVSAIGFAPIILCFWRFFGQPYPTFIKALVVFLVYALVSVLLYDPASLVKFDFYRRDGNLFISYAPILAGCVYLHRWDLNKVLKYFFAFAVLANLPPYVLYLVQYGLLAPLTDATLTFSSYFIARNAAGGFLAMLFCLGLACYMYQRSFLVLALLGLNAAMLLSTYSRGSLLGLAAVAPYLLFGRKRWTLACMIAAFIAASLVIAILHTDPSTDYLGFPFEIHNNDPKSGNLDIRFEWLWPRALAYFRESPLVGLGFGSFDDQISDVVDYFGIFGVPLGIEEVIHSDAHAHNSYLNILAELGVIGLALLLHFFWQLRCWAATGAADALTKDGKNYVAFVFIELSVVCLLAMSFSEHRLTSPSNVLILALVVSLLLAARPHEAALVRMKYNLPRARERRRLMGSS